MGHISTLEKCELINNGCATSDIEFNATICHIQQIELYVYLTYDKLQKKKKSKFTRIKD